MSNHTSRLLSLYRRVLRELPSRQGSILSDPSPLQRRIRSSFSSIAVDGQGDAALSEIQQAEQFVQYLQAQRRYVTLVERYNPGMNMNEEERVRLTARRVGMDLPVEVDLGKEKK